MSQESLFDLAPDEPVRPSRGPLVVAATDGSSQLAQGLAAGAWWVGEQCWGAVPVHSGGTNQLAELLGLLGLLRAAPADRPLEVVYDSRYAQRCITQWWSSWSRGGTVPPERWLSSKRTPVLHAGVIDEAHHLLEGRTVTWTWVRGHSTTARGGHPLNHEADRVAGAVVRALQAGREPDLGPGWTL